MRVKIDKLLIRCGVGVKNCKDRVCIKGGETVCKHLEFDLIFSERAKVADSGIEEKYLKEVVV